MVAQPDLSENPDRLVWVYRISPIDLPVPRPGVRSASTNQAELVTVTARFAPTLLGVRSFEELLADRRVDPELIVTREVASLVYILACSPEIVLRHHAGLLGLVSTGYLIWNIDRFSAIFRDCFDRLPPVIRELVRIGGLRSVEEIFNTLESLTGNEWPLAAGPVFRREGNALCIDLAAATNGIEATLEFPAIQGRLANARADHFENAIQAMIDRSCWRPRPDVHALKRRKLRVGGQELTDIDAIGEHDGTLLLVSCKSTVYSRSYDVGDYRTVRNSATLIRDAVLRWVEVTSTLRDQPTGDNYDLSGFRSLLGVVCTPGVIFVDLDTASRFAADGLRMASSSAELAEWLGVKLSPFGSDAEQAATESSQSD